MVFLGRFGSKRQRIPGGRGILGSHAMVPYDGGLVIVTRAADTRRVSRFLYICNGSSVVLTKYQCEEALLVLCRRITRLKCLPSLQNLCTVVLHSMCV